jgi:hypothetical protein
MLVPHPWQAAEVPLMLRSHRLLAWKPGVGKTLPLVLAGEASGFPQLWITRADLREQAARVIRAQRPGAKVQVILSGKDRVDTRADVVVVSYDMMRMLPIWKQLFALRWGHVAVDEAHALRDSASARTRAFYGALQNSKGALFRKAAAITLATGTPLLRDPMDLWPHVSRLWPEYLPEPRTKQGWENHHCVTRPGDYGPVVIAARRPEELLALIHRVGSVRELELATRLDIDSIAIDVGPVERTLMRQRVGAETWREMEALFADIDGGAARQEMQEQARLLAMTPARRVLGEVKAGATARIAIEELRGGLDQIIIWGYHVEALRRVVADMEKAGVRVALLNGSTPGHHRRHHVDAFTSGNLQALVCNLEVAGTGLDGLQCSHRALLMEPDWLPGVNAQAIARQYRQGQQHPVHVSLIVVARSPDEAVSRVLERRTRMITKATGAGV